MTSHGMIDRRVFLGGMSALVFASTTSSAHADTPLLTVATRQIEVMKRAATVYGITGADGRSGLFANEGDRFRGRVINGTTGPLVMHWHGQTQAWAEQDRSRPRGGELAAGQADEHDFPLTPGTHWMHAHQLTEQQLLAAPMIAREKDAGDAQDIVVILHDFAFRAPAEILAELGGSAAHGGHVSHSVPASHPMDHSRMGHGGMGRGHMGHGMAVHANDVRYDAYLANDRTLDDPDVVRVERGGKVRLRLINGATATVFFIDTGELAAECVAVDGSPCQPYSGRRFPLAQGQRLDLLVTIPAAGGAFPILAQVEADRMRTGLVLATPGAQVRRIADRATRAAAHADLSLDLALRARDPLPQKPVSRSFHLFLGEDAGYRWTINGRVHGEHTPLEGKVGERIEIMFMNPTSMMHPMHLHGHHFQVVGSRAGRFAGPVRDTVIVPPHTPVVVAVDLDKPGDWYLHCHHLYHMATGMMTELRVT